MLDSVATELEILTGMPAGPDRDARIDKLAVIPEPIVSFLAARIDGGTIPADEPMLAVLIKRHYREYELRDLTELARGRPPLRRGRLHHRQATAPTWCPPWAGSTSCGRTAAW